MKCPYCDTPDSKVVDSRPTDDFKSIRRRRECNACGKRFTTYEKVEEIPLRVIKRDGTRQSFDRNKLLYGMIRASEKRPVSVHSIENAVSRIEKELSNRMDKEITTMEVGDMVMDELKKLDEVAYVRFASVYRQFKDINTFMEELKRIIEEEE
ncbi:MAG: transcriptional regulator NrdR [Tissierellia bacterium]|nr:transcriptional regulator NrdR [Tissierellia bacterium]